MLFQSMNKFIVTYIDISNKKHKKTILSRNTDTAIDYMQLRYNMDCENIIKIERVIESYIA